MNDKKDKISLKDRIISKQIGELPEDILTNSGLMLGTLYGIKKRNMNFSKSVATTGLTGGALGMLIGSAATNALRLKRQHNKEFGTNPDKNDYVKIVAVNTIPSAIGYGVLAKNKDELENVVKNTMNLGKNIYNKGLKDTAINGTKNIISKFNPKSLNKIDFSKIKNINPKTVKTIGGLAALTAIVEGPSFLVTPETIINSKKKKIDGNTTNTKTASELIDEIYKKIASEK